MTDTAGETKIMRKSQIEVYCDPKVLKGLGLNERTTINEQIIDLGKATINYKGGIDNGKEQLLSVRGTFAAICRYGLPEEYVQSKIEDTNLILIQRDIDRRNKLASKRSIALIRVTYNPARENQVGSKEDQPIEIQSDDEINPGNTDMEVLVLCSGQVPNKPPRYQTIYAKGGEVIKAIKFLGHLLPNGIVLYGLETVVPLYYYFGWRFISDCRVKRENPRFKTAQNNLKEFFKQYGYPSVDGVTRTEEAQAQYDTALSSILQNLTTFSYHFYSNLSNPERQEDDDEEDEGPVQRAQQEGRDNGYRMLLCPQNNNYSPNSSLGKRKRGSKGGSKKRTKKKAPKKRHRKSKKARKSKKKSSWCKSSKSWCKYTKKNNCKKGVWSKKTKLGRASRKWCKVTKTWCKINSKTCKKRR